MAVFRQEEGNVATVRSNLQQCRKQLQWFETTDEDCIRSHDPLFPPGFPAANLAKDKYTKQIGIGWVFAGNNRDGVYDGEGNYGIAESAFCAEVRACLRALIWALAKGFKRIEVYMDCATLMTNLNTNAENNIINRWALHDIKKREGQFEACCIRKVDRQHVQRAHHQVANFCRTDLVSFSNV